MDITIKLTEKIHEQLKAMAKKNNRSLNGEILSILESGLKSDETSFGPNEFLRGFEFLAQESGIYLESKIRETKKSKKIKK